ncbi:MAG: hypothetical protein Q9225_005994 [Loekoesia sp. 1 TL-2023]
MQLHSSLLLFSFLFACLLSIASTYPASPGTKAASANSRAPQSSRNGAYSNNSGTRQTQTTGTKKKKEPADPPEDPEQRHPETGSGSDSSSDSDTSEPGDIEDDDKLQCPVPLRKQDTAQLEYGHAHGCKKLADAFSFCNDSGWHCHVSNAQKGCVCDQRCLCGQSQNFNNEMVEDCYNYLEGQWPAKAPSLKPYRGLC